MKLHAVLDEALFSHRQPRLPSLLHGLLLSLLNNPLMLTSLRSSCALLRRISRYLKMKRGQCPPFSNLA